MIQMFIMDFFITVLILEHVKLIASVDLSFHFPYISIDNSLDSSCLLILSPILYDNVYSQSKPNLGKDVKLAGRG